MQTSSQPKQSQPTSPPPPASSGGGIRAWLPAVGIFVAALVATLAFHLLSPPPHRTLCFDARQYLFDTSRVAELLIGLLRGSPKLDLVTDSQFVQSILANGPVLPVVFGTFFASLGIVPDINQWKTLEVLQSVMHAASSALVFSLSWKLTGRRSAAIATGLIWAFYPPAVFWSGVFYTETTVILLELLFVLSFVLLPHSLPARAAAGIAAGALVLLKPALLPPVMLLCATQWKRRSELLVVALFTAVTIAPWTAYTWYATGHPSITASRYPAFNLAMGSDFEADGCYVSPAPPLTDAFSRDESSPWSLPLAQVQAHPDKFLRLTMLKICSLWGAGSNDFRQRFWSISPSTQNLWHSLLIWLGLSGVLLIATANPGRLTQGSKRVVLASAVVVAGHLVYVLFTPSARYGLTSMPFVVILGALALASFTSGEISWRRRAAIAFTSALVSLGLSLGRDELRTTVLPEELIALRPGESVIRTIHLEETKRPRKIYNILLFIDGDSALESATVEINGHRLAESPKSLRFFNSQTYSQSFELRSLGYPSGLGPEDFRQWRAVQVPADAITWDAPVEVKVTAGGAETKVSCDPAPGERRMLSAEHFCVNHLGNFPESLDPRIIAPVPAAGINQESRIQRASGERIRLHGTLRIRLAVALGDAYVTGSKRPDQEAFKAQITPEQFDPLMRDPGHTGIRTNKVVARSAQRAGCLIDSLPELYSSHLDVRVSWKARCLKGEGKASIVAALTPGVGIPSVTLAATPGFIQTQGEWHNFEIRDVVPSRLLKEGARSFYVALYPEPWLDLCGYGVSRRASDIQVRDLQIYVSPAEHPDLYGKRVLYY